MVALETNAKAIGSATKICDGNHVVLAWELFVRLAGYELLNLGFISKEASLLTKFLDTWKVRFNRCLVTHRKLVSIS
jgi:hypothetical protein